MKTSFNKKGNTMHMSEKFQNWWKEQNGSSPFTSLPEVFEGVGA